MRPSVDTLRVALIGYGTGGAVFHAPLICSAPELELAAVVTANPSRQADVRSRYPRAAVLDDPALVWPGSYDLAVITTPNAQHVPLARAALDARPPLAGD